MNAPPGPLALLVSLIGLGCCAPARACGDEAMTLPADIACAALRGSDAAASSSPAPDTAARPAPEDAAPGATAAASDPSTLELTALQGEWAPALLEPAVAATEDASARQAAPEASMAEALARVDAALEAVPAGFADADFRIGPIELDAAAPADADAAAVPPRYRLLPSAGDEPAPRLAAASTHGERALMALGDVVRVDLPPTAAMPPLAMGDGWLALDAKRLDGVRGGFTRDNLNISFGIERAVYVNGHLLTTTSLNIVGGRLATGGLSPTLGRDGLVLVQSGHADRFTAGLMAPGSAATVIQNSLNGQKLQTLTSINATVNSLQILRGIDLQSQVRGAVIDSLRR